MICTLVATEIFNISDAKRRDGQFFTCRSPFSHTEFLAWAHRAGLRTSTLIEPFAGGGDSVRMLLDADLIKDVRAFDINPAADWIEQRNTLLDYPDIDGVVVTNPPYIARNSARRRRIVFPDTIYQDAYLEALSLMLGRSEFVAAILPAAFGTLDLFRDRLTHLIDLPFRDMFNDTCHPVCLALFEKSSESTTLWVWERQLGIECQLRDALPRLPVTVNVRFNSPTGLIGLKAVDTSSHASIAFVRGGSIPQSAIKNSSRIVTRLDVDGVDERSVDAVISAANERLERIRSLSEDVILTPFKGIRQDGCFRRRLDYRTARIVLSLAIESLKIT
ncbi:hypothetical protein ACOI1H_22690 [Loktanella sp. DJP18]|uniref:hypothetical protein n=1 Tax=Loktanella sp. DJP18 TaxID=3409788 RepID=UPI003BB8024F